MKKILPLAVGLGMGLLCLLAAVFFVLQLKSSSRLSNELDAKRAEFKEAQSASRKMDELERKVQELKLKEGKMIKRVAVGDTQPLGLIKIITASASKNGLRKIGFELKPSGGDAKEKKVVPLPGEGPEPVYFQMKFNSIFPQTLKFIKELNGLERIVKIEKIEIDRDPAILPYQAVVLDLVTYSFAE